MSRKSSESGWDLKQELRKVREHDLPRFRVGTCQVEGKKVARIIGEDEVGNGEKWDDREGKILINLVV